MRHQFFLLPLTYFIQPGKKPISHLLTPPLLLINLSHTTQHLNCTCNYAFYKVFLRIYYTRIFLSLYFRKSNDHKLTSFLLYDVRFKSYSRFQFWKKYLENFNVCRRIDEGAMRNVNTGRKCAAEKGKWDRLFVSKKEERANMVLLHYCCM